jgi:ClpP class serine protease
VDCRGIGGNERVEFAEAIGADAVRLGLADRIASFDEVLASLSEQNRSQTTRPSGRTARKGGISMSTEDIAAATEAAPVAPMAPAQPARLDAPVPQVLPRLPDRRI